MLTLDAIETAKDVERKTYALQRAKAWAEQAIANGINMDESVVNLARLTSGDDIERCPRELSDAILVVLSRDFGTLIREAVSLLESRTIDVKRQAIEKLEASLAELKTGYPEVK